MLGIIATCSYITRTTNMPGGGILAVLCGICTCVYAYSNVTFNARDDGSLLDGRGLLKSGRREGERRDRRGKERGGGGRGKKKMTSLHTSSTTHWDKWWWESLQETSPLYTNGDSN